MAEGGRIEPGRHAGIPAGPASEIRDMAGRGGYAGRHELRQAVEITVRCSQCSSLIGTWINRIADKYPFYCEWCEEIVRDSYPWVLTTRIVKGGKP